MWCYQTRMIENASLWRVCQALSEKPASVATFFYLCSNFRCCSYVIFAHINAPAVGFCLLNVHCTLWWKPVSLATYIGVCGHPSHNSAQKPHMGLEHRMITAIISLHSDSLNYGYEEQPSSLLMTDLLKASFQQACTRNPFKVLSIKPLNWSLKLFLQTVTRELLVSPFSVVSPVLHYSSSVPRSTPVHQLLSFAQNFRCVWEAESMRDALLCG